MQILGHSGAAAVRSGFGNTDESLARLSMILEYVVGGEPSICWGKGSGCLSPPLKWS